jgi:hypothetical protein
LGIPELTEPFCSLDNALYNVYLPNEMTFDRGGPGNTIEKGNPFCQFNHELEIPMIDSSQITSKLNRA